MRPIPPDPALTGLHELFPPKGAPGPVAQLVEELAGMPAEASRAKLRHVLYQPMSGCTVLWSFPTPAGEPLLVTGELVADPSKSSAPTGSTGRHGYISEQGLLVEIFPQDRGLRGLPLASSATWVGEVLGRVVAESRAGAAVVEIAPVAYKPRLRCAFRYAFEADHRRFHYFGKTVWNGHDTGVTGRLHVIRDYLRAHDSRWDVAAPVAHAPEAQLLILEAAEDAVELSDVVKAASVSEPGRRLLMRYVTWAARGLAEFRRIPVDGLRHVGPRKTLERLVRSMGHDALGKVAPGLADSITRRIQALEAAVASLPPEEVGLSHGAFRLGQILVWEDRVTVLDLDSLCLAGAGSDPGEFLAGLDRASLSQPRLGPVLRECEQAFAAALQEQATIHPGWLAWHRCAALVKAAIRTLRALHPAWPELAECLLQLGDGALADCAASTGSSHPLTAHRQGWRGSP